MTILQNDRMVHLLCDVCLQPPSLSSEQCNAIFSTTDLYSQTTFSIEPTIFFSTKYTCYYVLALALGLFNSPTYQYLTYPFTLEVWVHTTDMQVPALGAIASPVFF